MTSEKPRPTVDELFELLKRSNLPTVLVEGKNDIIFYRAIEEALRDLGVDMLPAGNKDAVLELRRRLKGQKSSSPLAFIVDNDLWVHTGIPSKNEIEDIITTDGYSVENDLFVDGDLINLLSEEEKKIFHEEVSIFCHWYALAVCRHLNNASTVFRTHPGKVLDNTEYYRDSIILENGEVYPIEFYNEILTQFSRVMRGKSLFAILHRQLSRSGRDVKFSEKQLMAFGASRKGEKFQRIRDLVRERIQPQLK
ncbi:DUF4435 domain-containing protein [Agrobacterium vitis]|uniref:DUF4435 domain-containing protein n=1 Tax=Agrobacterium vitis TaxID=373 RepID=A0A6L6VF79_AGRVI|nr:DUF4435 domain-containing protein [Agrobacterium vitis]MUZ74354.1 DUF4435 domain-containing protein [Agrobacterium vitis]MVA58815.1 DUF4435 domain-containing protein [Agrobacterium vitis]